MSEEAKTIMWYTNPAWYALVISVFSFIISVIILYFTWRTNYIAKREQIARELLSEGLAIHASMEAWILEGPNYEESKLSTNKELPLEPKDKAIWLRKVEVRAVLDQAKWNAPEDTFYNFIEGKRTWIVRDTVLTGEPSYPMLYTRHFLDVKPHPALISSRAMHELRGWIEKVANLKNLGFLSSRELKILSLLLEPISGEDRIKVLGPLLSTEAERFLHWYRTEYLKRELKGCKKNSPPYFLKSESSGSGLRL